MKEILKFLRDPKVILLEVLALILTLASNGVSLILPNQFSKLLDGFTQQKQMDFNIILLLIGSATAGVIVGVVQAFISTYVAEKIGLNIRNSLIKKLTSQTYEFITKTTPSKILTTLTTDITSVKEFMATGFITILSALFMLIGSLFLMIQINIKLTLSIFAVIPLLLIGMLVVFKNVKSLFGEARKAQDQINKSIDENIKASMLVRVFVAEKTEEEKFSHRNNNSRINSLKIVNVFAILIPIFTLFTGLVTLLIAWVGGTQIIELKLSLGQLTAFTTYVTIFTTPIFILGFLATSIGQTLTSAKRISEILTSKNTFINGKEKVNKFESLSFKGISFSLNKDDVNVAKLLNNISFEVKKGEKLGIIGSSGSGKSLILKLIMRFYEPIEGAISLNSKDIKEYEVDSYRNLVSFVPQENFIFNGTIKENITFGTDHRIDQDDFDKICKICAIDDFTTKFPHGYDEETGERGTTLSGGQKQRITLARALLRKPQILVLDDSTSRLDIKTERKILEAIQNEFPEITIIIVAQKVASISWCDQILVIEDGCIDSKGTHEDLKKTSFIYKEIELSQSNYNLETINA